MCGYIAEITDQDSLLSLAQVFPQLLLNRRLGPEHALLQQQRLEHIQRLTRYPRLHRVIVWLQSIPS